MAKSTRIYAHSIQLVLKPTHLVRNVRQHMSMNAVRSRQLWLRRVALVDQMRLLCARVGRKLVTLHLAVVKRRT